VVERPTLPGFGTELIERTSADELGGRVELEYAAGGLLCELIFPIE
jgi:two-component sensor histidine kinase